MIAGGKVEAKAAGPASDHAAQGLVEQLEGAADRQIGADGAGIRKGKNVIIVAGRFTARVNYNPGRGGIALSSQRSANVQGSVAETECPGAGRD